MKKLKLISRDRYYQLLPNPTEYVNIKNSYNSTMNKILQFKLKLLNKDSPIRLRPVIMGEVLRFEFPNNEVFLYNINLDMFFIPKLWENLFHSYMKSQMEIILPTLSKISNTPSKLLCQLNRERLDGGSKMCHITDQLDEVGGIGLYELKDYNSNLISRFSVGALTTRLASRNYVREKLNYIWTDEFANLSINSIKLSEDISFISNIVSLSLWKEKEEKEKDHLKVSD